MKLDPAVVHGMVLDQHGVVITDARGRTYVNPSIYTKEAGSSLQPRLYLQSVVDDITAPGDVSELSAAAGEWNGEVLVTFIAPSDSDDGRAFGYDVRYSKDEDFENATPVSRWRIPRPAEVGITQTVFLEGLDPGEQYTFFVQAYDKVGNRGNVIATTFTTNAAIVVPNLDDGGIPMPEPAGNPIRSVAGVLNYWACSELAKVNPASGARMADGYSIGNDDYKKANIVWDFSDNVISLHAGRNEVVGFQVIVERLTASLTSVSVSVSDLSGPDSAVINASENVELFKLHYVSSGGIYYGDPTIPLSSPFAGTFDIPSTNNPSGVCQSVWADVYVPRNALVGTYTADITLDCDQLAEPVQVGLQLIVHDVVIPDTPSFLIDLNGYGNKWSSEASRFQVFQLCQKHRMVPNTLPYGWTGGVTADRTPALTGAGPTTTISDWSDFTDNYGPFLDGSGFSPTHPVYPYHGPGENTPIADFYTAFHEGVAGEPY